MSMYTFDYFEQSNYGGRPIALYEFKLGTAKWLYCTGEVDVPRGEDTYEAIAIEDDGFTQSGDGESDDFIITIDERAAFNDLFLGTPPSEPIFVTMRLKHDGSDDCPIQWAGTLKSNLRKTLGTRQITCRNLTSSLNRLGLRLTWGRGCPHALYDRSCSVDPAAYSVTAAVAAMTGVSIDVTGLDAYGDGYFTGGYIEFVHTIGATERIAIESHTGLTLTALGSVDRILVGQMVTVYAGCDRVSSTCELKFNNLSNYGGFPHLPTKSPFDGDPVF